MRLVSLVFIVDGNPSSTLGTGKVLLGKKKEGFGAGHWNGFGGGVEKGESIEESACRETSEECGLTVRPEDLKKVAHIIFRFTDKPDFDHDAHVFIAHKFSGEPIETQEMFPQWHELHNVPLDEMWPADRQWVPLVLQQNKTIEATCCFIGAEPPFKVEKFECKEV